MGAQNESFKRYVEVGRVVLLHGGANDRKLAVIVDIIDANRALIDCPSTGVERQVLNFRDCTLTSLVVKQMPRGARSKTVKKFFDKSGVAEKFAESKWAKSMKAREMRQNTSDFDRFNVMILKKQRRRALGAAVKKVQA